MDILLTIIIPTYNMEKYLRKCFDSLIVPDDRLSRLEVLVVNDGSKDSSSTIAHEYETKYPQTFRVIDKENGNYGSCVNRGLKEAAGKYVKVLDADDYFDNNVFYRYIDFLVQTQADFVISDFDVVDEIGTCLSELTYNLPINNLFLLRDIPDGMNTKILHHAIAYKKDIFNKVDYKQTEGISYTDDEWIFKPMFVVESVVYFPQVLYHYLRGREGQTFDPKVIRRTLSQRIDVAKEMVRYYEQNRNICLPDNFAFVTEKLIRRVQSVYDYHLVVYPSNENKRQILDFDADLKLTSPTIYDGLNDVANNYGWHFIRQWRKMNYSFYALDLLLIRWKRKIWKMLKGRYVNVDTMPSKYKRQK